MERKEKLKEIIKSSIKLESLVDIAIEKTTEKMKMADPLKDLTVAQCSFALKVYDAEPCSLTEIARKANISKPSASVMVNKLVNKDILIREADQECRRKVLISTAPATKKFIRQVDEELLLLLEAIAGKMSSESFEAWFEISRQINEILPEG
ncbi:MarR family transcriptional regulator [Lentisphaerota bacterium ZTH]|nr:MarR family transcriptional regulator [Lentisphaerota bacterium]WET05715.1 MarR family transcriptional regulator [Lentisphaerota bacterium ZTH]